uniref:Heat shock transcription factor 4 n=1 Tax=Eptatretus burgeri TaxID=7764 RepID=A0A8C4R9P3_EPTBU
MDGRGGVVSPFLIKLWTLVDNQETNELIFWSANGQSFLVYDEHRFAKEILPKYFKHSKMNSFVRQLNMYGFCKVDAIRDKKDISEFEHPCFVRGSSKLLKKVKRKASIIRQKKIHWRDVGPIMKEMKRMRRTHETMNNLLYFLQLENQRRLNKQSRQWCHKVIKANLNWICLTEDTFASFSSPTPPTPFPQLLHLHILNGLVCWPEVSNETHRLVMVPSGQLVGS